MNKHQDYPSIEAFLKDHVRTSCAMALMTSESHPQTINGVNAVIVMANTRGASEKIRKNICGGTTLRESPGVFFYQNTVVHVESESTATHASLSYVALAVERDGGRYGRIVHYYLPKFHRPIRL